MEQLSKTRAKGQLQDIDLELCRFLQEGEAKVADSVLLAACLVSYLYRKGDVCLALQQYAGQLLFGEGDRDPAIPAPELDQWKSELSQSSVVGTPGSFKPLILDDQDRLYLHKFWHYEKDLADQLIRRAKTREPAVNIQLLRSGLDRLFNSDDESEDIDWQRVAAAMAVFNKLSIISGGPGTGKTSTVVRILVLLLEQHLESNEMPDIALTAPTGKAAARLKDSIAAAKKVLNVNQQVLDAIPDEAMTLHQLLGARRHTSSFRHDAENPVPYDIVVVDEASMVDQALMSKLMQALLTDARIILLGDKDQLASVEAGSVLGDICAVNQNRYSAETVRKVAALGIDLPESGIIEDPHPLTDNITLLTKSYRFGAESGIAYLSSVVNEGNADDAIRILHDETYPDVSLIDPGPGHKISLEEIIRGKTESYFRDILSAESVAQALDVFNRFRILAAHRRGSWGVERLNQVVEKVLQKRGLIPKYQRWYPGKPIIINVNDYSLGLHNGDTGICLSDESGELKIYFPEEGSHRALAPGRLPDHNSAFALTVHKSQGSEFDSVFLILPAKPSKVLSRELIYTAITRARTDIAILSTETVLRQAVAAKMERSSGLRDHLWMK